MVEALDLLALDPLSAPLRRLKGRAGLRLRVGDWRVLLDLDYEVRAVAVLHVLPRGRAYDR